MINKLNPIDDTFNIDGDEDHEPFIDSELSEVFDRYALALDAGDIDAADGILAEYPEVGEEFRVPFRGLYLLERAARQQKFETQRAETAEPSRLGDFEIGEELGRGGMGIVYAASQISLRRRVALKILPFTSVLDPRQVARFRNEAQAAASLHHPNIVPVYGFGCERGVHYYSMQLIEGQTMAQFIDQFRQTDEDHAQEATGAETIANLSTVATIQSSSHVKRIVEIGVRVAEAIHFAHENGIVHRDIKPSNLLLDQAGKIWVADFGLARGRGTSNLTSQGDTPGTLRYMSPEQASGRNNQVDFRTDIYSLGVTLYELLTLRPAFEANDRLQFLAAIERDDPVPLRSTNPAIPVDLETVISKAIAKVPSDRYSSAQEFADDLTRCLDGKPVLAKRKTALDRLAGSIAKNRRLVMGIGAALVVTALVATVVASVFYNQRQREHIAAENARFYLQQAHKSVDRFGRVMADELSGIPGTESLRTRLLAESIGYYDDFLKFAEHAPDLEFEQARAWSQLASLYVRAGDDDAAFKCFETANSQLAKLPDNPDAGFEQAVCFDKLGLLHKRRGEFERSADALNHALSKFESLDPSIRQRTDVLVASAQTRANLGSLYWSRGDLNEASLQFDQAISLLAPFVLSPVSVDDLRDKAELRSAWFKIHGNHVAVLKEVDLDSAEMTLRKSIQSLKVATSVLRNGNDGTKSNSKKASNPTRDLGFDELAKENSEHVADMQNNLAVILCHKNQLQEAEDLASGSIAFWRSRLEQAPLELNSAERLATSLNTLGEIHWRGEINGLGDESFAEAEKILLQVIGQFPDRPETLSRLGGVLHNRSLVAHRYGRDSEAIRTMQQAIKFQSEALRLVPKNARFETLLKSHEAAAAVFQESVSSVSTESTESASGKTPEFANTKSDSRAPN